MLDLLRHFLLVAEHGTITEAARRAHLSQPALTAAIKRLEDEVGAVLFVRGRKGAELTAAGRILVPRVQACLAAFEDGRRAIAEVAQLSAGEVRIGAGATACTYLLPPLLATFRRLHPHLKFLLREGYTRPLIEALREGDLDLAIITVPKPKPRRGLFDDLVVEPWCRDDLVLVGAPDIDPATAGYVTFADGSPTRALLLKGVPEADIVMELGSIAAVKGNVRAGMGLTLVSRAALVRDFKEKSLVEIHHPRFPVTRDLALVHRGLDRLAPSAAALRDHLRATPPTPRETATDTARRRRTPSRAPRAKMTPHK